VYSKALNCFCGYPVSVSAGSIASAIGRLPEHNAKNPEGRS